MIQGTQMMMTMCSKFDFALLCYFCKYSNTISSAIQNPHRTAADSTGIAATVMQFWLKRKPRLLHDYSLVGYMLSPNPTIMAHASDNKTLDHDGAAERLITKLLLDPSLVGNNSTIQRAKLINTFMEEYGDFINRHGVFARDNIWIMAADENCKAYRWHFKYSYQQTKVLGKLACLVLSKILGIGTAERNWKQVKAVKSGQRVNTSIDKTKKQVLIYAHYQQMRAQARAMKLSAAGKLWDDKDFEGLKMDVFCKEIHMSLEDEEVGEPEEPLRILRLWQERWELKKIGPQGNQLLEARLMNKYGGLKLCDIDEGNRVMTVTKIVFEKQRGKNAYNAFTTLPGYDPTIGDNEEANDPYWQVWEINEDLHDCMRTYYETEEGKRDNVKVFDLGGDCQSEEE